LVFSEEVCNKTRGFFCALRSLFSIGSLPLLSVRTFGSPLQTPEPSPPLSRVRSRVPSSPTLVLFRCFSRRHFYAPWIVYFVRSPSPCWFRPRRWHCHVFFLASFNSNHASSAIFAVRQFRFWISSVEARSLGFFARCPSTNKPNFLRFEGARFFFWFFTSCR